MEAAEAFAAWSSCSRLRILASYSEAALAEASAKRAASAWALLSI